MSAHLETLVNAARNYRTARFIYLKHATKSGNPVRHVEPYTFTEGKQDLMVRCFQLEPEPGWRFFMVHKITDAALGPREFEPRRPITLPDGEVVGVAEHRPEWTDPCRAYRDLITDTMADGRVTDAEFTELLDTRKRDGLTDMQIAFVHASLFHRCLGAVLDDGKVGADELSQLRFISAVLKRLGWCPGAST